MKRLRKRNMASQLNLGVILWLVCFASLLCGAGVGIGMLKNKQINVRRDMERMRVEINSCEKTKEHYEYKIASNTNRWAIRDRLAQNKSVLAEIKPEQLSFVRRDYDGKAVAAVK